MIHETNHTIFTFLPSAFESAGSFLTAHKIFPKLTESVFRSLDNQEKNIQMGILANAYSEEQDLKEFFEIFGNKHPIYADSGGLQVISIGAEITPELKADIYHRQALHSTQAMSFDEIPLEFLEREGKEVVKNKTDKDGNPIDSKEKEPLKVYCDSYFKDRAEESGRNIREQIQAFKKEKDLKSKVLFIIQGKTFQEAREWAWFCFQEVKKEPDYEKYVYGLALGNTGACGPRNISDFILRFQEELEFLPKSWRKNLHVLGAGSPTKLLAYLMVADSYFWPNTNITADATTQSRAMIFGNFLKYEKLSLIPVATGREYNEGAKEVVKLIWEFAKPFILENQEELKKHGFECHTEEDFREHFTEFNDGYRRKREHFPDTEEGTIEHRKRSRVARFWWTTSMISAFLEYLTSLKKRAHLYRHGTDEQRIKIEKSLKISLPKTLYKASIILMKIKSHKEYIKSEDILSGHPYKEVLDLPNGTDGVQKYKGKYYQTCTYEGKVLGRPLTSCDKNAEHFGHDKRGQFLALLGGAVLDTISHPDVHQDSALDEW